MTTFVNVLWWFIQDKLDKKQGYVKNDVTKKCSHRICICQLRYPKFDEQMNIQLHQALSVGLGTDILDKNNILLFFLMLIQFYYGFI